MTALIIFITVLALGAGFVWWQTSKKKEKEKSHVNNQTPSGEEKEETRQEPEPQQPLSFEESQGEMPTVVPTKPIKDLTPKFKVGDVITDGTNEYTITEVRKVCYVLDDRSYLPFTLQDKWSIVEPEKPEYDKNFEDLVAYFSQIVDVKIGSKTWDYLYQRYISAVMQYNGVTENPRLYVDKNYPTILDFYTNVPYMYADLKLYSWLFAMILTELMPENRSKLYQMAYDYKQKGKEIPIYGWSFETDPNICRDVAAFVWAITRDADKIGELRSEVGGSMLTYKKDISETFVDISKFLPPAPSPFIKGYDKRKEIATDDVYTEKVDRSIHDCVSLYYSLDTKDAEKRQATIQAIANKEYKIPHLFGKPRTVTDPKYGQMTIYPVFGKHNIRVEIPEDSEIAKLCYEVGKASTDNRKSQLDQEYGRRRPGQGDKDGTANSDPKQRVLVNYAIEEGDGHSTGFYNQDGDYVSKDGVHIGDFETYFQSAVYANSYTSGHSAFIEGVANVLAIVMPDRADLIIRAKNEFANSRIICRYHWQSDTTMGKLIGTMMLPIMFATTNCNMDQRINKCKEEYKELLKAA